MRRSSAGRRARIAIGLALMAAHVPIGARAAAEPDPASPATADAKPSKVRSEEDGAFDLGGFLDQAYGFVPLLIPITEPAVGYGAALGLVFIDRPPGPPRPGLDRPNLTAVGGFATENDTRGVMAGDVRHWGDDRVQTLVGGISADVNLDFYGVGEDGMLADNPVSYNLDTVGGGVRARYRFGGSHLWAGLSYVLFETQVSSDEASGFPGLAGLPVDSRVGGVIPFLAYDTRDNIFTPTTGIYFEGGAGLFEPALGSDTSFQRVPLILIGYTRLHPVVFLGVRGGATFSFGEVPFYLRPFIGLRGAPVLRYQGEHTAEIEAELRWQHWKRWSLVGFVGGGLTWNDFDRFDDTHTVLTGGAGFRYELARKYGLHVGLDVAAGPDDTAIYIQFGSAWARP